MAVVATGFFDGVHKGHREVIDRLVSSAHKKGEEAIIITFARHPRAVLQQDARNLRLLNSLDEKVERLKACGVDRVEVLDFSKNFASLLARDYIASLIERLNATQIVMGYDNRLGSDKLTPDDVIPIVNELGVELEVVEAHRCDSFVVSSTKIRTTLSEGRIEEASNMLGYDYSLKGVVVSGKQLGRKLGYPTANMQMYDPLKILPGRGVYFTEVRTLGSKYSGMTNVGDIIETHIFDFNEDIYGLDIEVIFKKRIRNCIAFNSLDDLKTQLALDEKTCKTYFM